MSPSKIFIGKENSLHGLVDDGRYFPISTTDTHTSGEVIWKQGIRKKIHECHKPIEQFLDTFVPSQMPCPSHNSRGAFKNAVSVHQVVEGLERITADFPSESIPRFAANEDCPIPLRIGKYKAPLDSSGPSIVTSHPGQDLRSLLQWNCISLGWQVKPSKEDDPVGRYTEQAEPTLLQLLEIAQNIMIASHALFAFAVGLYGNTARIFRFDHSGVIASRSFSYLARPNILRNFLWRFAHPLNGGTFSGTDPSVRSPTQQDLVWAREVLNGEDEFLDYSRWFTIPPLDSSGHDREFLAVRPLHISISLFSRATCVWEVLEKGDMTGRRYVLKDAWRLMRRDPETKIYRHIHNQLSHDEELFGVADMACGRDLGEAESGAARQASVSNGRLTIRLRAPQYTRPGMRTRSSGSTLPPRDLPPLTYHRTVSATFAKGHAALLSERSHMRLVYTPVGRSLKTFNCTRELVEAMQHAIKGHRQLSNMGVLHRDVSQGNVMISDNEAYKGFIGDFDMCLLLREGLPEAGSGVIGTWYFRAIELLDKPETAVHGICHDLEGFFWLLVWNITLYTEHTHRLRYNTCSWLFSPSDPSKCCWHKKLWIIDGKNNISVVGNEPLTALLQQYRKLCFEALARGVKLSYENVLPIFDAALAMDGWPEDDSAPVSDDEDDDDTDDETAVSSATLANANGGSRKRRRESQTDDRIAQKPRLAS